MGWNPSADNFKRRMLELQIAMKDIETKEIYLAKDHSDIHHNLFDHMNKDRFSRGLPVHDIPVTICFDDYPGRGYIRKDTGEFMQANDACEWASTQSQTWSGESLDLRRKQTELRSQ